MMSEDLEVIEPADSDFDIKAGTHKTLTYHIVNNRDHPVRNIYFNLKAIKPDGTETSENYITLGSVPQVILAHEKADVRAEIEIPLDYSEYIVKDVDGVKKNILTSFKLVYKVGGDEYIEEL